MKLLTERKRKEIINHIRRMMLQTGHKTNELFAGKNGEVRDYGREIRGIVDDILSDFIDMGLL